MRHRTAAENATPVDPLPETVAWLDQTGTDGSHPSADVWRRTTCRGHSARVGVSLMQ